MQSQSGHFTLRAMPRNAQPGMGSLPQFMPSNTGDAPAPKCRVSVWNPERGDSGKWDFVSDSDLRHGEAVWRAVQAKESALEPGDTVRFTDASGAQWKVDVE